MRLKGFSHRLGVVALYDRYLAARVRRRSSLPEHIALIITERDLLDQEAFERLEAFLRWSIAYEADRVTVYVSVLDTAVIPALRRGLQELASPVPIAIRDPGDADRATAPSQIGIGLGGKHELATAVAGVANEVKRGELSPNEIDESDIEGRLVFPDEPDLVIKTGAERLSDFMIWQSVYSELYFTDVNWQNFRRRDFLRALLEYTRRSRRYGR